MSSTFDRLQQSLLKIALFGGILMTLVALASTAANVLLSVRLIPDTATYAITAVMFAGVVGYCFLMTPASNILNVITVPLGYEYSSCPYCWQFGISKIEYADCEQCGEEHVTNWGSAWYPGHRDDLEDKYEFCNRDCRQEFKSEVDE